MLLETGQMGVHYLVSMRTSAFAMAMVSLVTLAFVCQPLAADLAVEIVATTGAKESNATFGVGSWIWDMETRDRQECHFVRQFEIPRGKSIRTAHLRISADNFYSIFIDGRQIGQGADWRVLIEYDISLLVGPGKHVMAVQAVNDFDVAGLVVGLRVEFVDGSVMAIGSDETWKVAPPTEPFWKEPDQPITGWHPAKVVGPLKPGEGSQIYKAPVSMPLFVPLWQRREFQFSLMIACGAALLACLFLVSRLMMKSRTEKIMRQERARIAADLHDDLGGGITQLVLLGHLCRREVPQDSPAAEALERLDEQSSELLSGMNDTVWMINSQRDNTRDLASYIIRYAETFFARTPIRCRFDGETMIAVAHCDIRARRNLFLAVKEALNNVLKHSGASEVTVGIQRESNELVVVISDNGRGFELSEIDQSKGNGLGNIKKRVVSAGGRCDIRSSPGAGCIVTFRANLYPQSRYKFLSFCCSKRSAACIS